MVHAYGMAPADVEKATRSIKYRMSIILKYDTKYRNGFLIWSWFQLIMLLLFISYLFGNIADRISGHVLVRRVCVPKRLTELMDKNKQAFTWNLVKDFLGLDGYTILATGSVWQTMDRNTSWILLYFLVSSASRLIFVYALQESVLSRA